MTFQFQPKQSRGLKTRTVAGEEFVWGFAQHILPKGFRKVRYFGWMASNSRTKLDELRMIVWYSLGSVYWLASAQAPPPQSARLPQVRCAACGGVMTVIKVAYHPIPPTLVEHALAYLDSG